MIVKVGNKIAVIDNKLISVEPSGLPQGTFKIGNGGGGISLAQGGTKAPILVYDEQSIIFGGNFTSDTYVGRAFRMSDLDGNIIDAPEGTGLRDLIITGEGGDILYIHTANNSLGNVYRYGDNTWQSANFAAASGYTGNALNLTYDAENDIIYAAGSFATYGGLNARRLVAIDGTDGSTYAAFDTTAGFTTANGSVWKTLLDGNDGLIAMGQSLTVYGGVTIPAGVCRISTTDGSLDQTFNSGGAGPDATNRIIYDGFIDAENEHLYLISNATSFNGTSVYGVFRLFLNDGSAGQLDTDWIPAADGPAALFSTGYSIMQDPLNSDYVIALANNGAYYISKTDGTVYSFWDYWGGSEVSETFKAGLIYALVYNTYDEKFYMTFSAYTIDEYYYIARMGRFIPDLDTMALINDTSNETPETW